MHPSRRRKKRPSYGIRTVEVARGPNGFGFTISGQQPCILSCIVANSPADQAGLRAGDFLISVNGVSVSKITHDAVVGLIGNCVGPIKMTIAENYYSDSSDEELNMERAINQRKPKYSHKPRLHRTYKFDSHKKQLKMKDVAAYVENYDDGACGSNMTEEGGPIEYKAIVGYLGTIEMPKQLLPNSRLQTVCTCIKKLRQEKRKPTAVLMTVLPTCLTLKNASNHILAIYPTNRVVYISSTADKESRYFGLVTSAVCDRSLEKVQKKCEMSYTNVWNNDKKCNNDEKCEIDVSNSCHVFVTDPKIVDHSLHAKKAESFHINCTTDVITGNCLEFPPNALYIVSLVQNMYRLQSSLETPRVVDDVVANSPQPSASSNSDSGIGFRDDCGNISDRILVVEFPNHRQVPIMPSNNNRPINIIASNINAEMIDLPLNNEGGLNNVRARLNNDGSNINNIRACEGLSIKNVIDRNYLAKQNNLGDRDPRLNCRAMPAAQNVSPEHFAERAVDVPFSDFEERAESVDNVSMHSAKSLEFKVPFMDSNRKRVKRPRALGSCDSLNASKYEKSLLRYKLSPKVYGLSKPNYSCEELSKDDDVEKCGGSLRDFQLWFTQDDRRRNITQSEPDVRIGDNVCEDRNTIKASEEGSALWSSSFEKLLECPVGLHTFAEFLKKEFSAENIYFWTACERYRKCNSYQERCNEARRIYQQHLRVGAPEAVNVDSQARQCTEQALKTASPTLFSLAQKQIFNLMKFDSYSRFLKSDIYKQCLAGNNLQYQIDPALLIHVPSPTKLKKSLSNAEDRRRKSLLPWHRKNRSKSKEREEDLTQKGCDLNENISLHSGRNSDVHSSRSSLTSLDVAIGSNMEAFKNSSDQSSTTRPPLCRVTLVNGSTTVVQIKHSETIYQLVIRLLEKRGISYSSFEVLTNKHPKPLNINDPSSKLAGCEVEVQQRVTFRLDLPNKKIISVKSKCSKILADVLRQILNKYGFALEDVLVTQKNDEHVDLMLPVTSFDTARLNVLLTSQIKGTDDCCNKVDIVNQSHTLDEITNRVYEDILQEKSTAVVKKSDKGSVKSEDWGSEHSSGLLSRFIKRDSERNRERKKKFPGRTKTNSAYTSVEDITADNYEQSGNLCKKPLIAKLKAGVKLQNTSESEELYEGLSRAQRSRLEDQRGTEINFELPDFLKDKENEQSRKNKRIENNESLHSNQENPTVSQPRLMSAAKNLKLEIHSNYENRTISPDNDLSNVSVFCNKTKISPSSSENSSPIKSLDESMRIEPPPLPPKPKILPIKPSNWKQRDSQRKECVNGMYLEQPTSSFV